MFENKNAYTSSPYVSYRYGDEEINFPIVNIMPKKSKSDLMLSHQFTLFNSFIAYKGEDYRKELGEKLTVAHKNISSNITNTIHPMPYHIINDILDMVDPVELRKYIKDIHKLPVPKTMDKKEFDKNIEKNDKGTRAQTYIADDYYDLATLVTMLKPVIPVIGYFGTFNHTELSGTFVFMSLFSLLSKHSIMEHVAMDKIKSKVEVLIRVNVKDAAKSALVIEKGIPEDEIKEYIVSMLVIQMLSFRPVIDDNIDANMVTKMYNFIINKSRPREDVSNRITEKKPIMDSDTGDDEGMVESYRFGTKLPIGFEEEIIWITDDLDIILNSFDFEIDPKLLKDGLKFAKKMDSCNIDQETIYLLCYIFKSFIHPSSMQYVTMTGLINLLGVGFAYLWANGAREMAVLLISTSIDIGNSVNINMTSNRSRLLPEIKDKLEILYPYEKPKNETESNNLVVAAITALNKAFASKIWVTFVDDSYVKQKESPNDILPSDFKNKLGWMLIGLEENKRK